MARYRTNNSASQRTKEAATSGRQIASSISPSLEDRTNNQLASIPKTAPCPTRTTRSSLRRFLSSRLHDVMLEGVLKRPLRFSLPAAQPRHEHEAASRVFPQSWLHSRGPVIPIVRTLRMEESLENPLYVIGLAFAIFLILDL